MSSPISLEHVLSQATQLSIPDKLTLIAKIQQTIIEAFPISDEPTWTPEEIAEMTTIQPLTGKEIIEQGLASGWEDLEVDVATWVQQQRSKRQQNSQW